MTCPACNDTGYEAIAEDEVAPCTHPLHIIVDHRPHISDLARAMAADPRFAHIGKDPEWFQGLIDQEDEYTRHNVR